MLRVDVYKQFDQKLDNIWLNLSINSNSNIHPFNSYNWNKIWYENLSHTKQDIKIFVVSDDDLTIAILPMIKKKILFSYLENFGSISADYCPILIDKSYDNVDEIINVILNKIKSLKQNFINIEKIQSTLFHSVNSEKLKCKFFYENLNTYLLDREMINSKNYIKKVHKNNLDTRRQIRRLKKLGKITFKIFEKTSDHYQNIIHKMISFKSEMYQKTNKRNIFKNQSYKNFYINLFTDRNLDDTHVSCLFLNDKIISVHLGFVSRDTFYYLMPSYDLQYSKYSPGKVLLNYLFNFCDNNNIRYFDFTVGNEEYKKIWANQSTKIYNFKKFFNIKGLIVHYCLYIKSKIRSNITIYKYYSIFRNFI